MNFKLPSLPGLTGQLKDKLIQQALEKRLAKANAPLEHAQASKSKQDAKLSAASSEPRDSPSGDEERDLSCRFDQFPGYKQIQILHGGAKRLGLSNPFFKSHDGRAGAHTTIVGKNLINFASYNYLDLSGHPRVNQAAVDAISRYGTSVSASRVVSGDRPIHQALEQTIAEVYGTEAAVVFVSGHATNVSTISCLFGPRDLIVHDEYIHNSAMQGIQLSGAKRLSFAHNDWKALESLLAQQRAQFERVLIIVEGIYSMDGDYPDLPRVVEIKRQHRALLMVDEAHSLGVMGKTGRGIREHFNLKASDVDIWMGTLSKALAGCGGYVTGERALVEHLKYLAPGFLYSVGMSPPLAAASLAALQCMLAEPARVDALQSAGALFLKLAQAAEISTGTSTGLAIIPAIVGSSIQATRLAERMFERGINVQPILYPAVPEKSARLRFFMSCRHTAEDIHTTVSVLAKEYKQLII
jgi:8-amino-7-oxononanoate synthase